MRRYTMREAIRDVQAGNLPPELNHETVTANVALAGALEMMIHKLISVFAEEHPDVDIRATGQALLCAAAVQIMAACEMPPDDFAELARECARLGEAEARALRAEYLNRARA